MSGIRSYISLRAVQDNHLILNRFIKDYPILSGALYIVSFTLMTIAALPVTMMMIMIGGFLFNISAACCYTIVSMMISSLVTFGAAKYLFSAYFKKAYAHEFARYGNFIEDYTISFLITARMMPVIPFFIINVCAGLMNIDTKTFIITTAIGIVPTVIIAAFLGSQCAAFMVAY